MASDEPVLLRVSPIQNRSNKCSPKKEFSKSNSIDNLISSLEESSKPSAKLENGEVHRNGTSEHSDKLNGFRENDRLSPANDSNRQRKDSGDPICADFYCEIGTTIEMTSRNVELLNQKNAEKRELRIGADERPRSKFGSRSSSCSSASNSLSDKVGFLLSKKMYNWNENEWKNVCRRKEKISCTPEASKYRFHLQTRNCVVTWRLT